MRTLDLLNGLDDSELKEFTDRINTTRRNKQKKLLAALKVLIINKSEYDKLIVFDAVFEKAYHQKLDYLLRNELRHLNTQLYDFITEKSMIKNVERNKMDYSYWLLNGLYNRGLFDLFEKEIEKALRLAKYSLHADVAGKIFQLKIRYYINKKIKNEKHLNLMLSMLTQWKAKEKRNALYKIRRVESWEAYSRFSQALIQSQGSYLDESIAMSYTESIDLNALEKKDMFAQYLHGIAQSYVLTGERKINQIKEIIDIIDLLNPTEVNVVTDKLSFLSNLTVELILQGRHLEAEKVFKEIFEFAEINEAPIPISSIQNYISNQINLSNYKNGLDYYEKNKERIENSRSVLGIKMLKAYCYLFIGDTKNAVKVAIYDSNLPENEYINYRFIQSISFYLDEEFDLAIRELENLQKVMRTRKVKNLHNFQTITGFMLKYFKAMVKPKTERNKLLVKLIDIVANEAKKSAVLTKAEISFLWLLRQLKIEE